MPIKLVDERDARREEPDLGMCCDTRGIPDPLAVGEPRGWWLSAMAFVQGGYTNDPAVRLPTHQGLGALVVTPQSFHAIVAPEAESAPAAWVSAPLGSLKVEASGSQGPSKKRPQTVEIAAPGDGWSLTVAMVSRLFRSSNRARSGQESSLVEGLAGSRRPLKGPA